MKIRFLLLLLLGVHVFGQEKECAQIESQLDSLVKLGEYDNAHNLWKTASKCASESIFQNGEKILVYKLSTPLTDIQKGDFTSQLLSLYTDYDKKIVGNKNSNRVKKAMFVHNRKLSPNEEVYGLLDSAFKNDRANFTDAAALYLYFDLYLAKFKAGDKSVKENELFARHDDVSAHLSELFQKTSSRDYETARNGIQALMKPVATCDKLEEYYQKEFLSHRSDVAWMQNASESLLLFGCARSATLDKIASEMYALQPNAQSAFLLAKVSSQRGKPSEAAKYYTIAADSETNPAKKAEIYYTLAVANITDTAKALEYLDKSLKAKQDFGQAYLLKAEVFASSNCGTTDFEKKAIYFLASKTALKAGEVDPSMKKVAESTSGAMLAKAPKKSEIKEAKKAGKTVSYACGINESVTIPE